MRFLVDANLPRSTVTALLKVGHEVEFARDIGLGAAADQDVAAHARSTDAVLLTRDLDFANIRQYPPENYAGIVVLRLPDDATAGMITERGERRQQALAQRRAVERVDHGLERAHQQQPGDQTIK